MTNNLNPNQTAKKVFNCSLENNDMTNLYASNLFIPNSSPNQEINNYVIDFKGNKYPSNFKF